MEVIWLSGWGLDPAWWRDVVQARWPDHTHRCAAPTRATSRSWSSWKADVCVGYSLGAALLLTAADSSAWPFTVRLLAPFSDLRAGRGGGGKVDEAKIRWLRRWTARDPLAALGDFYRRAGIDLPTPASLPYPLDDLLWGLDTMIEGIQSIQSGTSTRIQRGQLAACPPDATLGWIGSEDALVDALEMKRRLPGLHLVEGAGHDPRPLLSCLRLDADPASSLPTELPAAP